MTTRITLNKLAENLIRESRAPFTAEDYLNRIQDSWRRKISPATLADLKRKLINHDFLIGMEPDDFLPYKVVLEKLGSIPVSVSPGKMEVQEKILILGHRLIPFVSGDLAEESVTFLDSRGKQIPKIRKSFYIDEVIHHYQYSNDRQFPDKIKINECIPGKSTLSLAVWDMRELYRGLNFKFGDELLFRMVDYDEGVFRVQPFSSVQEREDRMKTRSFHVALETELYKLCSLGRPSRIGLEKQVLRIFFSMRDKCLEDIPAFSLPKFVESNEKITLARSEKIGIHFVAGGNVLGHESVCESIPTIPKGKTGSLDEIFKDLGLACNATEFKAILYVVMGSDELNIESVFALLFGGSEGKFYDTNQHSAFYRQLRKLLAVICEELKFPEPRVVSQIRSKAVSVKMRLIEVSRFLESLEVKLEDLPPDFLDLIGDLDHFCVSALEKLSDRLNPPDIKSIRDIRLALKIVFPTVDQLEEEIFSKMGVY